MNVKQLIKELQKYDPKTNVEIDIGEIKNEPIKCVKKTIYNSNTINGIVIEPRRFRALCLKKL